MAAQPKQETHVETPDLFKDAEAVIATARQQVETALKVAEAELEKHQSALAPLADQVDRLRVVLAAMDGTPVTVKTSKSARVATPAKRTTRSTSSLTEEERKERKREAARRYAEKKKAETDAKGVQS